MLRRAQEALELAAQATMAPTDLLHELDGVVTWTAQNSGDRHAEFLGNMLTPLRQASTVIITE